MDKDLRIQKLEEKLVESEKTISELKSASEKLESENTALKNKAHAYNEIIHSSPSMITLLSGKELIIEIANKPVLEFWQKKQKYNR